MRLTIRSLASYTALALGAVTNATGVALGAQQPGVPDSVLAELRKGGLVLVFRHAHTARSKMDDDNFSMTDRTTQRNLSDRGMEQSKAIGGGLTALGIRIGQVLSSPMFRTLETAEHAFGRADTTELLRTRRTSGEALALLTATPDSNSNRVLVTHNAYIMHHFTKMGHGEIAEGEVIVVRPLGAEGYRVIGRVKADDWARLGAQHDSPSQRQRLTTRALRM